MIISDKYKFVFVHIPKWAGSSVRNVLKPFNEKTIPGGLKEHPNFGMFDYNHIPLSILRQFFSTEYQKVCGYYSFAIMRDPFTRFPSSIRQRLGFHLNRKIQALTPKEVEEEVYKTISLLDKHSDAEILPAELIHFQKQKSYIYDGDKRIVDSVYSIENIEKLYLELSRKTNLKFSKEQIKKRTNKSPLLYKNKLVRGLIQRTKPIRSLFLTPVSSQLKEHLISFLFTDPKKLDVFNSGFVINFISRFYKEDILLYNDLFEFKE